MLSLAQADVGREAIQQAWNISPETVFGVLVGVLLLIIGAMGWMGWKAYNRTYGTAETRKEKERLEDREERRSEVERRKDREIEILTEVHSLANALEALERRITALEDRDKGKD